MAKTKKRPHRFRRAITGDERAAIKARDVTEDDIIRMKAIILAIKRGKLYASEEAAREEARWLRGMKLWFQIARPRTGVAHELADLRWKVVGNILHSRPKNGFYLLEEFQE